MASNTFKVSDTYLKDFATQKLGSFVSDINATPFQQLSEFAAGKPGTSGPDGADPSGSYNTLLGGNGTVLNSAATLAADFKTLSATLTAQLGKLSDDVKLMQQDLLNVDKVITDGGDKANLTAAQMSADLQNLDLSGSSTSGSGSVPPPVSGSAPPPTTGGGSSSPPPASGGGSSSPPPSGGGGSSA